MTVFLKLTSVALVAALLVGCGDQRVEGDVFVVTKGHQTVLLSLVDVKFYEKRAFDPKLEEVSVIASQWEVELKTFEEMQEQKLAIFSRDLLLFALPDSTSDEPKLAVYRRVK